jgi:hypothetical protein
MLDTLKSIDKSLKSIDINIDRIAEACEKISVPKVHEPEKVKSEKSSR